MSDKEYTLRLIYSNIKVMKKSNVEAWINFRCRLGVYGHFNEGIEEIKFAINELEEYGDNESATYLFNELQLIKDN